MLPIDPAKLMPDDPSAAHLSLRKKSPGRVPDWVWQKTGLETLVLAENDLSEVSDPRSADQVALCQHQRERLRSLA